jgi:peptidoglycan/LPS O-acetylase OafA/YrhL
MLTMVPPAKPRIDALTSLRFFAAALIVLGHAGEMGIPGYQEHYPHLFMYSQGVSFFFVLSGFILYLTYADIRGRTLDRFFVARLARIWPAHILAFLTVVWLLPPDLIQGYPSKAWINVLMLQSVLPTLDGYFSYNDVSWSISTELFFYLMFPVLLLILRKSRIAVLALGAIFVGGALSFAISRHLAISISATELTAVPVLNIDPITRVAEFILGMVTCYWLEKVRVAPSTRTFRWHTLTLLELGALLLCFGFMFTTSRVGLFTALPPQALFYIISSGSMLGFAALIGMIYYSYLRGQGLLTRLLGLWPFVYLGEISFSLYLFHRIILRYIAAENIPVTYWRFWAVALVVAALSYEFWEKPWRAVLNGGYKRLRKYLSGAEFNHTRTI